MTAVQNALSISDCVCFVLCIACRRIVECDFAKHSLGSIRVSINRLNIKSHRQYVFIPPYALSILASSHDCFQQTTEPSAQDSPTQLAPLVFALTRLLRQHLMLWAPYDNLPLLGCALLALFGMPWQG